MELRHHIEPLKDYGAIILAARSLLSSVTRILLLVDIIVVKKLLTAKKRASESLEKLESVMNFTEFVRAFSVFGTEMIELAYLTGHHRNSFKEERRRAQMFSARQILEKSIAILLTHLARTLCFTSFTGTWLPSIRIYLVSRSHHSNNYVNPVIWLFFVCGLQEFDVLVFR